MRTILLSAVLIVLGTPLQAQTEYIDVSSTKLTVSHLRLSNDSNQQEPAETISIEGNEVAHVVTYTDSKLVFRFKDPFFNTRVICINDECGEFDTNLTTFIYLAEDTTEVMISVPMHKFKSNTNR